MGQIMCKANFAIYVIINTPRNDVTEEETRLYVIGKTVYICFILIFISPALFTSSCMRRIYSYILSEVADAQASEDRCQDGGTEPQRNTQPAARGDRRSPCSEQPFFRPAGSSANPLRDATSASHRGSVDRGGDARLRRVAPDVLSRTDRVHREGSRRLAAAAARPEGPPQAFQRSPPTHSRLEKRRPNCHDNTMRPGDSTTLRDQRASPQSRTRSAEQKKTAQSALTHSIPARAAEDYEALRGQIFGIERPGVPAAGFSVLIRCGLAAWAQGRHDRAALPSRAPLVSAATAAEHGSARSSLAKLIASMILRPRQEMPHAGYKSHQRASRTGCLSLHSPVHCTPSHREH